VDLPVASALRPAALLPELAGRQLERLEVRLLRLEPQTADPGQVQVRPRGRVQVRPERAAGRLRHAPAGRKCVALMCDATWDERTCRGAGAVRGAAGGARRRPGPAAARRGA